MASKSIFDDLLGSLGGSGAKAGTQGGAASGGIGDLLNQVSAALGGGRGGASSGGGLGDMLGQLTGGRGAAGGASSGGLGDLLRQVQGSLGGTGSAQGGGGGLGGMIGDRGSFTKGAAAGGLMGALLGGKGTAKAAGVAVIGSLAWKAYQNWKAQQATEAGQAAPALSVEEFAPQGSAEQLSEKLARAMVAAAKADGKVTSMERRRILDALNERGLGADAQRIVEEELDGPLDVAHVASMAASPEEAVQIYTASLLSVDPEEPEEQAYLAELAERLGLAPDLVAHLHQTAGA